MNQQNAMMEQNNLDSSSEDSLNDQESVIDGGFLFETAPTLKKPITFECLVPEIEVGLVN